jgi:hypothetical protein
VAPEVRRWLVVPGLAIAVAGAGGALAVRATRSLPADIFYQLFVEHDLAAAVLYAVSILAAAAVARRVAAERVDRAVEALGAHPWPVVLAAVAGLSAAALTVYHNHPLALDEYSQYFQAEVFAAGQVFVEYPDELVFRLIPRQFVGPFFEAQTGRVISSYWPGFPLLLAPFVKAGIPWLLNPLLAGGSLLLLARIARRLLPGTAAPGWAVLFALASPQFTVNAISYYAMGAHLFLNLAFVALLLTPSSLRLFLAGLAGSLALVLHQPLPHAAFAIPWIVWLALVRDAGAGRGGPGRLGRLFFLFLGYLPLGLLLGVGWYLLLWQIPLAPADAAVGEASGRVASGFLSRALTNLGIAGLPQLDVLSYRAIEYLKLFLWAVPGLPVLAALGAWRNRRVAGLRLLGWAAVSSLAAFFFVPFPQGHGWGYRYFHQAWGAVPLLAAALVVSAGRARAAWTRVMGTLAVLSLVAGTALRFIQVDGFIDRHLGQLPTLAEGRRQVCFLATQWGYYRADLVQNDPLLRDPVVILVSFGRQRDAELMRRMEPAARPIFDNGLDTVWLVEPGPETGDPAAPAVPPR